MFTSIRIRLRQQDSQRLAVVATTATCGMLLIWAAAATATAVQMSRRLAVADVQARYLSHAAQANRLTLLRNAELHRVFGELRPYYNTGTNYVHQSYLRHFDTKDNSIAVLLANETGRAVRPNFEIRFLNAFGFLTGLYRDSRPDVSIPDGEESISQGDLEFRYGEPVYFSVVILDDESAS